MTGRTRHSTSASSGSRGREDGQDRGVHRRPRPSQGDGAADPRPRRRPLFPSDRRGHMPAGPSSTSRVDSPPPAGSERDVIIIEHGDLALEAPRDSPALRQQSSSASSASAPARRRTPASRSCSSSPGSSSGRALRSLATTTLIPRSARRSRRPTPPARRVPPPAKEPSSATPRLAAGSPSASARLDRGAGVREPAVLDRGLVEAALFGGRSCSSAALMPTARSTTW